MRAEANRQFRSYYRWIFTVSPDVKPTTQIHLFKKQVDLKEEQWCRRCSYNGNID